MIIIDDPLYTSSVATALLLRTTTVVFVIDENELEVVRYPLPLEVIVILFIAPFAAAC